MIPPTIADFNYRLDDHCFYAEDDEKVIHIAKHMEVYDSLMAHQMDAVVLSFFYTDRHKVLDLALFLAMPEAPKGSQYLCFYFKDFLRVAYNIGTQLHEHIPFGLIDEEEFKQELLGALNYLLQEYAPNSKAAIYQKGHSWGFYYKRYKGMDTPSLN